MLYYDFGDYEGFKERFGVERDEKGELVRKNKILLSFVKNKNMFRHLAHKEKKSYFKQVINIKSLSDAVDVVHDWMKFLSNGPYDLRLNGSEYHSDTYQTDEMDGITEDGSIGFIRYVNMKYGEKVYKMKAGKMYRHILDNNKMSDCISDEMKTYMCEVLTEEWKAYQSEKYKYSHLYVDEDFEYIYSSDNYAGDFNSCMSDMRHHLFYENIDASAACICRSDGHILARCIIFNEVYDEDGNCYRLAERQYAADGNLVYMRMLINALIKDGYIDGYKAIGAGCGEATNFLLNNGERLNRKLHILANLDANDTISYQDSFKWYDPYEKVLYNVDCSQFRLDTTDELMNGVNYDEWNECHTFNETVRCCRGGCWYDVDKERLDCFIEVDGVFHHEDDVCCCDHCKEYYVYEEAYYSKLTKGYYCCEFCLREAEDRYREDHNIEDAA